MESILIPVIIVGVIGLVLGIGLTVASILLAVPVDEKVTKIREALPGANCGACGFSGCDGYAEAVAAGNAEANLCVPGGADTSAQVAEIAGVAAGEFVKKQAFVLCRGDCGVTSPKYDYKGLRSCAAASLIFRGPGSCGFGCIGFGDCAAVCEYGAISVKDGLARINGMLCAGCGKCVSVCPKGIIDILPSSVGAVVRCSNKDKGAATRKVCTAGCIGCKICEKKCPSGAVKVENNLAVIDPDKCTGCGICADSCPQKCIN